MKNIFINLSSLGKLYEESRSNMASENSKLRKTISAAKQRMGRRPDFRKLDEAYKSEDYRRAVFIAQDLVYLHPTSHEAQYKLALALSRDNQILRSKEILEHIVVDSALQDAPKAKYKRALTVVDEKIKDSQRWVDESLGSREGAHTDDGTHPNLVWPSWLKLRRIALDPAITGPDLIRQSANINFEMQNWRGASKHYENLLQMGKAHQKDLRNHAKSLIKMRDLVGLNRVLAELNNLRARKGQASMQVEDLAASVREFNFAVEHINADKLNSIGSVERLDELQRRMRAAGRVSDALRAGLIIDILGGNSKQLLRTGLYAEQTKKLQVALGMYLSSAEIAKGKPTAASIRAARIRAEQNPIEAMAICYEHWAQFDKDYFLVDTLLAAIDIEQVNGAVDPTATKFRAAGSAETASRHEHSSNEAESESLTFISNLRRELLAQIESNQISLNANAARAMRRKAAMTSLESGDKNAAINESLKQLFAQNKFDASDFVFAAYILARTGDFQAAVETIAFAEHNPDPYCYQAPNASERHRQVFRYLTLCDSHRVLPNVFLWESHFGNRVDCNPYAMWHDIVSREDRTSDIHVWVCDDDEVVPQDVLRNPSVVLTSRESAGYWFALAVSKYLVNNASFPFEFMRRPSQKYANTWHGTPLKALGRADHDSPYDYGNVSRNFLHATELIMPNEFTASVIQRDYCIANIGQSKVEVIGQARNDRLVSITSTERRALRDRLGLQSGQKFVLYAPTWRGGSKSSWFDIAHLEEDLDILSSSEEFVIGFRGHPLVLDHLESASIDVLVPDRDISTYDLLAVADVVVTDYSSLGVDFLCRQLPVIYYVHDYVDYSEARGLNIDRSDFPGIVVDNRSDLLSAILSVVNGSSESQEAMSLHRQRFALHDDGYASSRAIDALLSEDRATPCSEVDNGTKPILMTHALRNRDSLESFIRAANGLAMEGATVVVCFDYSEARSDNQVFEVLESLSSDIRVLPRKGMLVRTPDEYQATESFYESGSFTLTDGRNAFLAAIRREGRRLFGQMEFGLALCWGVENPILTALCAYGVNAVRRIGYVDTCLKREIEGFYPSQARSLQLLEGFDDFYVVDDETRAWIASSRSVHVTGIDRGFSGDVLRQDHGNVLGSEQHIVVVGGDLDIDNLRSAARSLRQVGDLYARATMYIQGPAREAVADTIANETESSKLVIRTDDYPYARTDPNVVLVDCSVGTLPTVLYADAVLSGQRVVRYCQGREFTGSATDSEEHLAERLRLLLNEKDRPTTSLPETHLTILNTLHEALNSAAERK